jgi:putative ABC transport system permease protein
MGWYPNKSVQRILFFFKFFIWFSLRNMRRHPGRALTVLLGIALGASVFTSVRLSIHASLDSFTRSMELMAGRADRVLIRPGGSVPEQLVADILKHPLVESAAPVLTAYIRSDQPNSNPFLLMGFDPILDDSFREWKTAGNAENEAESWLNLLKDPRTLIASKSLALENGWQPGEDIHLENARQSTPFRVVGVLASQGLAKAEGGRVAITDIATFQEFSGGFGRVDRIDLQFKPDVTDKDMEGFGTDLPEGIVLSSPLAVKESGQAMIRAYQLNLSILSFASLFVGMFLVYSLVALNAAARRHELAVLRSIGGSPYLLLVIFLAEGALFGVAGWIAAIPISSLLVKYLLDGVSQTISTLFVRVQVDTLFLSVWEISLSFGLTVFISVLAAFQPAREAMQVLPKEALEISQQGSGITNSPRKLALAGLVCILMVLPLSSLPGVLGVPLPGYLSLIILFVGFSMVVPSFLVHLGDTFSPILNRLAGVPAYLAARYVRDSGARTAVSVGALITAVALFASLVIMIHSFRRTVELWVYQTISGDLFLTPKLNEINQFRQPMTPEVVGWFQTFDSAIDIVPNRRYFLEYDKFPYEFEVLDLDIFLRYADFFWLKGDPDKIRSRLRRGDGVIISEVFSNRTGLTIGDTFKTRIESSRVELPILGLVRDYRTQGGVVFYSMQHFKARYHDSRWSGLRVYFRDRNQDMKSAVADLRKKVQVRWGSRLDMISGRDLRTSILRVFDETFAVTTVLLLIALAIAALGIATTLTVQVLERSRQLNTLTAIGAGSGQIRSMIFWEAAFMVAAGEIAGIICGFILSYLLVYVINRQSFGWTFLYSVDWQALALSLPLIVLTALAAAIPATKMVFRKPPATLLRE